MQARRGRGDGAGTVATSFESIAESIMYRWSVERDTWVSTGEVEHARAYLLRQGIVTTALADGRYTVDDATAQVLGTARLVLLALRHLHASRRGRALASDAGSRDLG
jgi:hypothetical protein